MKRGRKESTKIKIAIIANSIFLEFFFQIFSSNLLFFIAVEKNNKTGAKQGHSFSTTFDEVLTKCTT